MFATKLRPADVIAAVLALLAGFAVILFPTAKKDGSVVRVESGGALVGEYALDSDISVDVSGGGYTLTLTVSGGSARVTRSDCPGGDCMRMGEISESGDSIVCLPAGVLITVTGGGKGGDVDAVAG